LNINFFNIFGIKLAFQYSNLGLSLGLKSSLVQDL